VTGAALKKARLELDWSQEQVAQAIGVNRSTILRYESGEIEIPKRSALALKRVFQDRGIKIKD
jgi:transcriptional regulator with XRE-family HTH domain